MMMLQKKTSVFNQAALFVFVCLAPLTHVHGQELKATVKISAPRLQVTDARVIQTLERTINDFLNNMRWTDHPFESSERIECDFQINILEELGNNTFKADIALQSLRPVYGSHYKTALISHVDKDVIFSYEEYQPIEDSRNFFRDNLSALFTFYALLIVGSDFDSFEMLGGESYFRTAQGIISSIPPGIADQDKGWNALSQRTNRFWLMENILNPKVRTHREAIYQYHRYGLDMMQEDVSKALPVMKEALVRIDEVRDTYPNAVITRIFVNAKSDEVIEIFKGADRTLRSQVMQIMRRLDISNANKYNVLRA